MTEKECFLFLFHFFQLQILPVLHHAYTFTERRVRLWMTVGGALSSAFSYAPINCNPGLAYANNIASVTSPIGLWTSTLKPQL